MAEAATPVIALVSALRDLVGPDAAASVHVGATSQDIVDTAMMLVARRALEPLLADARGTAAAAAELADRHRATPMAGRTLMQQALPTSFGVRAAGWLVGIDESRRSLTQIREQVLAVQMGGPVGLRGAGVAAQVASDFGLAAANCALAGDSGAPGTTRGRPGTLAGVFAKLARDVTLLTQDEIGELREGGSPQRGGSTAMAHKRNPVAAVSVLACAKRVPGLVATIFACMEQEHERAAGAWQAEWGTLTELLSLTGSATAWARDLLEHLQVDADRMRENLGRLVAAGVDEAADPDHHFGAASELIDMALAAHRS